MEKAMRGINNVTIVLKPYLLCKSLGRFLCNDNTGLKVQS